MFQLLNRLGFTATRFADEIGVQRSGISHILSGRNQPSYDFILKTMKRFPDINIEWLLVGNGEMMKTDFNDTNTVTRAVKVKQSPSGQADLFDNPPKPEQKVTYVNSVKRIILLHADGTFTEYQPSGKD